MNLGRNAFGAIAVSAQMPENSAILPCNLHPSLGVELRLFFISQSEQEIIVIGMRQAR
jgi:hypothetical protein